MTANASDFWQEQADEPETHIAATIDYRLQDAYWQSVYWSQPYYRADFEYEDYAAAFCVGYTGFAQYGGSFADAEKSLCANWVRIKGDSRLSWEEALPAIRAAWQHAEQGPVAVEEEETVDLATLAAAAAQRAQPAYAAA